MCSHIMICVRLYALTTQWWFLSKQTAQNIQQMNNIGGEQYLQIN